MSRNYNAGQYEETFIPKRLQMYQIPRDPQPGMRSNGSMSLNTSSFLADGQGHLLPGIEKSKRSPFGEFIGTWDLPKRVLTPAHINPMGRTEKNFNTLCAQHDQTNQEMEKARVYQKERPSIQ